MHCHFSRGIGTVCLVQHPNVSLVQANHPFQLMGTGGKPLHPQQHHGLLLFLLFKCPGQAEDDTRWLRGTDVSRVMAGKSVSASGLSLWVCVVVWSITPLLAVFVCVESNCSRAARLVMQQRQCHSALGLKPYQSGQMDNRLPCGCTSAPEKAHHIWLTVTGPDSFGQDCK